MCKWVSTHRQIRTSPTRGGVLQIALTGTDHMARRPVEPAA